jgi:anaerobic ribonucleoside-triphosphate reductase activating protein
MEIDLDDLVQDLLYKSAPGTEGLTLSGGEPLQQPWDVLDLIDVLKTLKPDWSIGMFTGYTQDEAASMPFWGLIRATLDFAVMGRYDRTKPCNKPLVSSANQELVLLSTR